MSVITTVVAVEGSGTLKTNSRTRHAGSSAQQLRSLVSQTYTHTHSRKASVEEATYAAAEAVAGKNRPI